MRIMDHVSTTFDVVKNRFTEVLLVGLEAYLFMMALQSVLMVASMVIFVPILLIFPFFMMGDMAVWTILVLAVVLSVFGLLFFLLSIAAGSMMMGGMINCMLRIRSGEKLSFGDLFRYGWEKKWDLIRINIINTLLVNALVLPFVIVLIGLGAVLFIFIPVLGVCLSIFTYMAMIPLFSSIIALQYLPFIIWMREGTDHWNSIKKAWRVFFDNFWSFVGFGLIVFLFNLVAAMIPGINILAMMMVAPSVILALIFIYEELFPPFHPVPPDHLEQTRQGFVRY